MDKKLKLKNELAKKLKKETSATGTGASVTPGVGMGVATKYAFKKKVKEDAPQLAAGKVKDNYAVSHFGFTDAPSKPNRPSKAIDYKELWEDESNGFKSGKEFINIKLKKYPKALAKINQLIDMIGEDKFTMDIAKWVFDFFNNASFESPIQEAGEYDSLAGILKQLGAEEDSIKVLIKAVEMGALKPTDAITIVKKALGKKEIKEAKLDIDDRVKVTYGNEFYGETGTITDISRGFVTVEMDKDGNEYSMHSSDVQKIEDEDDEDMLQEGYAQFRNETKMRSKPDQFHQAVKQIKRKMNEINRIFEYVDRLKSELSEGEELKYKKYTENAFQQIKESAKALFLKSTKLK